MMEAEEKYRLWLSQAAEDPALREELEKIAGDGEAVNDRFYRELEFGTGGLRGVLGAGTNRMNIYTVRKATQGLASYLLEQEKSPSVAIAYDSRVNSEKFAWEAARVLAANRIYAYIYPELMPTPALSFAVRELGCTAGICVTASHNPAKYNGYKVYGPDGCQITLKAAGEILSHINQVDPFTGVRLCDRRKGEADGYICTISEKVRQSFLDNVQKESTGPLAAGIKVVYTPLNGAGRRCVTDILARIGVRDVTVVPSQEMPDGNFPTCPYPNPEIREALAEGLRLCEREQPDLLLATDPDCDRVGVAVKTPGGYRLLTGNETGALLLDFIARRRIAQGRMPERPVAVKTIVTTDLAQKIAEHYGIEMINVLTGFKFIGEQIGLLEEKGEAGRYIFGFEESYGYLSGTYVRDKDAVNASMLICEMAADCKAGGMTLADALEELGRAYGYYENRLLTFTFEGEDGMEKMSSLMDSLRREHPQRLAGSPVTGWSDYMASAGEENGRAFPLSLPRSDVLEFRAANGCKLIVRPSGTEPKLKAYLSSRGGTKEEAAAMVESMAKETEKWIG